MTLDRILTDFKMAGLTEAEKDELNRAWHRLRPWPDSVAGLTRLKKKFIIAPLSNGNISLMTDMAKHCRPAVGLHSRRGAGAALQAGSRGLPVGGGHSSTFEPADVMMVAAHLGDLRAAKAGGLQTAFVARPLEYGPTGSRI